MKEIEEDENHIELLRQALLFYANKENYHQNQYLNDDISSLIELDNGSQARFALSNIEKLREYNSKIEADYMKDMNEAIENSESPENVLKIIEGYKNIGNED